MLKGVKNNLIVLNKSSNTNYFKVKIFIEII